MAGLGLLLHLFHRRLRISLAAPREAIGRSLTAHGLTGREVSFPTVRNRTLRGWWLDGEPDEGVAIITHGWGANREMMLPLARSIRDAGWSVLLFDARNHGESDEDDFSSMPRFAEDTEAAIDWVQRSGTAPIVLIGHSVGAAAVLLVASRRRDIGGVISLSAFAHPEGMMRRWLAWKRLPFLPIGWYVLRHVERVIGHRFDDIAPVNTLPRVDCPVLLAHGRSDPVIPFEDAQALYACRGEASVALHPLPGGHDLSDQLADHRTILADFLRQCRQGWPTKKTPDPAGDRR
ncbi:alpha/beta hydrolase [Guyparkeria sp. XI15]|nr:alpha/beta hydrolase [Guyparkeria sp. XI15]OAE88531.1 alpha/beta hydrolase [Guyparkeria sp. WRN-7]